MEQTISKPNSALPVGKAKIISLRDLIKSSFSDWRRNWQKFAYLLLIPLLISYAISLVSFITDNCGSIGAWPGWWLTAVAAIALIIFAVAVMILYVLAYISEFLLLKDLSQEVNFKSLGGWYKKAKPYFWPAVLVTVVFFVLAFFCFLFLVIPGIIFCVYYGFAIYAVIFEDHKFEGSFGRSRELVSGYWWPVFGRFLAGIAIVYLAYLIIGGIYAGIIWLISAGLQLQSSQGLFALMYDLLSVFVGLVVGPLSLLYASKIYQSLREVKNI